MLKWAKSRCNGNNSFSIGTGQWEDFHKKLGSLNNDEPTQMNMSDKDNAYKDGQVLN